MRFLLEMCELVSVWMVHRLHFDVVCCSCSIVSESDGI